MTTRLAAHSLAALLAMVGLATAHADPRPPTKIVPQPASQLQQQQGNQATTPTTFMGRTLNLTPEQAATLAAWQQRVRQVTDARLGGYTGPRIDASMGSKDVTQYAIPMKKGAETGVLTLPSDAQIGVWLGGPAAAGYDNAKPGGTRTLVDQIAPPTSGALDSLPQIKPVPMTDAAVADAMQKYPKSDGWTTIWLGDRGKLWVKGDPCDIHTIADAFSKLDKPTDGPDPRSNISLTDYGHALQGALESQCAHRHAIVQGPDTSMRYTPTTPPAAQEPPPAKFTLSGSDLSAQAAAIRQTMSMADDDGRLERSLALTEAAQPLWRSDGLKRLANVYLANPNLVKAPVEADFDKVDESVLRSLVTQAVTEAQRGTDGRAWIAVAALMAAQRRPEQALAMLPKASKLISDDATLDKIDELAAVLRSVKVKP